MFFHNSTGRKVGATVLLIILTFWISFSALFGAARPARAQYVDPVTSIQTTLSNIWNKITDALVEGVSVALANAANYFMSQLAYQIAVGIVSGCPGQKSCTVTSFLGDAVKGAAQGALGEALGSLSKAGGFEALGINLCAPPSANFGLSIQLGLLNEAKPPAPKCDFNQVMNNWKTAASSLSPSELQKNVWQGFKPGAQPLSMSLHATETIKADILYEKDKKLSEQLAKMSGAGGFQDVTDMVTKKVKTPAAAVKAEFERGQREKYEYPKIFQQIQNAGQQARGSVWGAILLNAAQTFGQTLLAQLWNKLVNKIFASQQPEEEQPPELILTEEGTVSSGKAEQEEALQQTSLGAGATPVPMTDVGVIDPMSQFSICPETGRGQWNCVIDTQLASAVRLGTSMPLTVAEAVDKGYLRPDWPLIPAADKAKNSSDQCFSMGYCQGNLAKLRAARILPVGWEIAASLSSTTSPYKLKEALDNFDNPASKLYHLIDPGWVLKQPLTQCKAQVFGALPVSPEISRRSQVCVDAPTCLREDDYGTCVGGWGYCSRERNVWRFNGDTCPEQFNTCRTLKGRAGQTVNYITNTIDRGTCSASNVGCRRYASGLNAFTCTLGSICNATSGGQPVFCPCTLPTTLTQCQVVQNNRSCLNGLNEICVLNETQCNAQSPSWNASGPNINTCNCSTSYSCSVPNGAKSCSTIVGNSTEKGDDWRTTPAMFFNKSVQSCSVDKNGCTPLLKFGPGQSLNLVKNGDFESLEDADGDGEPDHAQFWSPFGAVLATGPAVTVKDASQVISGSASLRVGVAPTTTPTSCTMSPCNIPTGCPCTSGSYKCLIVKGESGCTTTSRLAQGGIQVAKDRTYTLSASVRKERCGVDKGNTTCTLGTGGSCSLSPACGTSSATWDGMSSKCFCYTSAAATATMRLSFMDGIAQNPVTMTLNQISTVLKGGTSCTVSSGSLELAINNANFGTDATAISCSFLTNVDVSNAKLEIYGSNAVVDEVMLEEGGGSNFFHNGYGDASESVYAKIPPAYLGCTGEDNDLPECQSFAGVCRDGEVGCNMYTPASGDPPVPGIVGPTDFCPAECDGYDVFKQGTSEFERQEKFPIYFIPATAKACTEAEVGCSEFTDILTEEVAYYSNVRMCQMPSANDNQVFYSWEGSDTTGYQLKVWTFKMSAGAAADESLVGNSCTADAGCATPPKTACRGGFCVNPKPADVCADPASGFCPSNTAGPAPCTQIYFNSSGSMLCADKLCSGGDRAGKGCSVSADCTNGGSCSVPNIEGRCSKADIEAGNLDCRELYDEHGNRHYRLLSKTIVATPDCRRYRITAALKDDCEMSNGKWDAAKKECVYLASLVESSNCPAQSNGCRAYKGNAATNVNVRFSDTFESGVTEWSKTDTGGSNGSVSQSSESVSVGGHSLKILASGVAYRDISGQASASRSYSVSFWARGSGRLKVAFANWKGTPLNCKVEGCAGSSCQTCILPNGLRCNNAGTTAEGGTWNCNVKNMADYYSPSQPPEYTPFSDKVFRCTNNLTLNCTADSQCGGAGKCTHADYRCADDLTKVCRTSADCTGGASCLRIAVLNLSSDWRQYTVGPVIVANSYFGLAPAGIAITTDATSDVYIDNFLMKEVQDNIFVVRDSWSTPQTCDQALDGSPAPLEMLGCRKYSDTANKPLFLRTFSKLCREKSVGCAAYSNLQNTPENYFEKSYNAVCRLNSACVPAGGMANCVCNYKLSHPAANASYPPVLPDVCRVQASETECRFTLDGLDTYASRSAHPDIAFTPADQRLNLVIDKDKMCGSADAGCKTFGSPTEVFEGKCTLSATTYPKGCPSTVPCDCTDAKTGQICKVPSGETSCKFSNEKPIISEWKATAFKDNPAQYEQTLCREDEVGCDSYTAKDGVWYFKDPGNAVCEYKDTVTISGVTKSGWFRKSDSGSVFPCYPELLREGKFYEINRNRDKFCALASTCGSVTGCFCFDQTNPSVALCRVAQGNSVCGYRGWVGLCDAKYNYCEEFVDPLATTSSHPAGEPYYYIVNNKLDRDSCAGSVSLKQGCVMFNQTSVAAKLFSAPATYTRAFKETGSTGGKVNALNCDTNNRNDLCKKRCVAYKNAFCHKPCTKATEAADCAGYGGTCTTLNTCSGYADEGKECWQDSECAGHAASGGSCLPSGVNMGKCSDNLALPCVFDADCKKTRCAGQRVFGMGCAAVGDCNGAAHEACVSEPAFYESSPLLRAFTKNDTNIVLKVRRDRECAQWLTCYRESTTWDETTKKYKSTCTDFTSCGKSSQVGQVMDCVDFVEPPVQRLTSGVYQQRDVSWAGLDYSGYSLPERYPIQYLAPIKAFAASITRPGVCVADGTSKDGTVCNADSPGTTCGDGFCSVSAFAMQRFGVKRFFGGAYCTSDSQCVGQGACQCIGQTTCSQKRCSAGCTSDSQCTTDGVGLGLCAQGYCYYNLNGGTLELGKLTNAPSCRAYPEADSPYGASVLDNGAAGYNSDSKVAQDYSAAFKGANVCMKGHYCECGYKRIGYGKNQGTRYVGSGPDEMKPAAPDEDNPPTGICSGGVHDGRPCRTSAAQCAGDTPEENGICVKMSSQTSVLGWPGFCIDRDTSIITNNDAAQPACNLWLPVDALAGMPNRYNQYTEAGFFFDNATNLNFCSNAEGTRYGNGMIGATADKYGYRFATQSRAFDGSDDGDDGGVWSKSLPAEAVANPKRIDRIEVRVTNSGGEVFVLNEANGWTAEYAGRLPGTATTVSGAASGNVSHCRWLKSFDSSPNVSDGHVSSKSGFVTYSQNYWDKGCSNMDGNVGPDCQAAYVVWNPSATCPGCPGVTTGSPPVPAPPRLITTNCDNSDGEAMYNADYYIFYRETCQEFVDAKDSNNPAVAATNVVYNLSQPGNTTKLQGYFPWGKYWEWSALATNVVTKSMANFGRLTPIVGDVNSLVSGAKALAIALNEGGTDNGDPSVTSVPLTCTGGRCNNVDAKLRTSAATGRDVVADVFVKAFAVKDWNGSTYVNASPAAILDKRQSKTAGTNLPVIVAVDTKHCYDDGGNLLCLEARQPLANGNPDPNGAIKYGLTVNDIVDDADVKSERNAGRLKVSIKYYAWADPDHMPIRRRVLDFGDASVLDDSPGYYKNHRGGTGTSKLTKICGSVANTWGFTDASCEPRYFEESKTYICNIARLAQLADKACQPIGSPGEEYPCMEDGACVFRPRVQIIDNWGFCNGDCPGGLGGSGSACMNSGLNSGTASYANGDECVPDLRSSARPPGKTPWSWFAKRIFVYPNLP